MLISLDRLIRQNDPKENRRLSRVVILEPIENLVSLGTQFADRLLNLRLKLFPIDECPSSQCHYSIIPYFITDR